MLTLATDTPQFYNEICEMIRAFEDVDNIILTDRNADMTVTERVENGVLSARASFRGEQGVFCEPFAPQDKPGDKRARKHAVKLAVYDVMKRVTHKRLPWGALTGIRPTKFLRELSGNAAVLEKKYDLPPEKSALLARIDRVQEPFLTIPENEIDVYIDIPFCRTRCSYCSFSTTDSTKGEALMRPYVTALMREADGCVSLLRDMERSVRCLYIGGGTPTALTEGLFEEMLTGITARFAPAREYTVEAGRPDTITEAKLRMMKSCGVDRISINPQSMQEETLLRVGRSHTPDEIRACFLLARQIGFETINADLIAGLPGETPKMFADSLEKVMALIPENITVHTLALKRGSRMAEAGVREHNAREVGQMVDFARETLTRAGYQPYYLYRQKYMTGNFENIGYALPGHEGVYNIDIMEETCDILALGAGGTSKRVYPTGGRIERAFNVKGIAEYASRAEEAVLRKRALFLS